mmetsp:Transcript_1084/g.2702  ORF Transcript_1084/g.2702 Transcript_1084/m.2702 type:complete len:267 (-) Transcript_1084:9-809(-)
MRADARLSKLKRHIFPIHQQELKKFIPLVLLFFMISFNYAALRSLKNVYVLKNANAEVVYYLKLFGVTPTIFLFMLLYSRISKIVDRDRRFNVVIIYFFVFFSLSYIFFIPHATDWQFDLLANDLNTVLPAMQGLWESVRHWPISLFYIHAEVWGSMVFGVLFWTFANEITGIKQSKRFYSFLALGGAIGFIIAGILLKAFQEHLDAAMLGLVLGITGITWGAYNRFAHNIRRNPTLYQIEAKPEKKKEKLSFTASFRLIRESKDK